MWWIVSEVCYYLGLTSFALVMPALAMILWLMSLVDRADPNYWDLLIAWVFSGLMFGAGIVIKRRLQR